MGEVIQPRLMFQSTPPAEARGDDLNWLERLVFERV